jgi:hypothetical protein
MQFLAQIPLMECDIPELKGRQQSLLLFQCQHDPGSCDEWDADSGGNAAILTESSPPNAVKAPSGETTLPSESKILFEPYDDSVSGETPDENYCRAFDATSSKVLGKLGGQPLWIQGEETPSCSCGQLMVFVAQIESRGGGGINFGDAGAGYAFVCTRCPAAAKFLWQCG